MAGVRKNAKKEKKEWVPGVSKNAKKEKKDGVTNV